MSADRIARDQPTTSPGAPSTEPWATGADDTFGTQLAVHRRELQVHCYRMTGSVHDAEDLAQETLERAWRSRATYDPQRAGLRTWLYRIATNVCLTALQSRARRPLPSGLGPSSHDPDSPLVPDREIPWLQPLPSRFLDPTAHDPAALTAQRDDVRLALIAAFQLLPPRQRAVLILRDVLGFGAAEVATQLQTTVAGVNSALQRARAAIAEMAPDGPVATRSSDAIRETVDRYVAAFQASDVEGLVRLLTADVVLEMPPVPLWYVGRTLYGRFMTRIFGMRPGRWRLLPTSANGQPAVAAYSPGGPEERETERLALHTLQVLTVADGGISRIVVFQDPEVFEAFGLARTISAGG